MMGRILLATIIMTIFLVVLTQLWFWIKAFPSGSVLASLSDSFGGATFFVFLFKAIPAGLTRPWRR